MISVRNFWKKFNIWAPAAIPRPTMQQKNDVFLMSGHDGDKKFNDFQKDWILGQKAAFLAKNFAFFYA